MSGAEFSLMNLVKNIDRSKFIPIFVLPEDGPFSAEIRKAGIEVRKVGMPQIRRVLGVAGALSRLIRLVKDEGIQLIHSNSIRTHIYGAIAARSAGIPIVWHERNLITDDRIDPDRLFSFIPDRIICNSRAIAHRFLKNGKLPERVEVIYNGVDTERFSPAVDGGSIRREFEIGPGEVVVGIASRLNVRKGHETFLRAAKILLHDLPGGKNKLRFLIAGGSVFDEDMSREKYLANMADELGIEDRVIFAGVRTDMPEVYAAMDIFVLASDAEPCGRAVLEAMAAGKALVATKSGGTPEMVEDGISGFLVVPRDPEALADRIAFLCNHIDSAKKMGMAARRTVEERFKIGKHAEETERVYLELTRD